MKKQVSASCLLLISKQHLQFFRLRFLQEQCERLGPYAHQNIYDNFVIPLRAIGLK